MKKFYLSILLIAATFTAVFSQVPSTFNYQAVVRNASGEILANKTISFRISLLKNTETGEVVYSETHSLSTNNFGLVNLKIGGGAKLSGTFSPENWGEVIFTKVELDPEGGSSFSHLATTKLSSVPFAFMAQTVVNDMVDDADADATNEIQTLSLSGTLLELSNGGGSVTLPASGGGGGDNWGAQSVNTNASLTGDGTSGSPLSVVADGDGDDSNELQTLSINASNLTLSDGGGTVALPASPWNETASKVEYIGDKIVSIKEGSGSGLKTKSGSRANPPKLEVSAQERTAISIYNETSLYPGLDIWNEEGIAAKFNNNSDKPVAVFENYDVGLAAQFKNEIQIADGTQGDGKVLTSDADGKASWESDLNVNDLTANGDVFINQNLEVADDLTVGSVTISGSDVKTQNTGDANMLPIAFGKVSGGNLYGHTSNVSSVEKDDTGKYKINISGFTAYNTTVITATKMGGDPWVVAQVGSFSSGYIKINVYDIKNDDYIDGTFSFIVYQK